jgi:toxin ParE1/3/4
MADVRRSPQAEIDLEAILADLNQKNPAVAERSAAEFAEKANVLAQFPEIAPDLRSSTVYPCLIFYRYEGGNVQVIRILHGKQDLSRIMREETVD